MRFNYQARTKTGDIQSGVVEASSREAAFDVLKSHGLYVTALEEAAVAFYAKKVRIFERITAKHIVVFSRQVAIMFKSKVPLVEIFQTLARQMKNSNFREKILKISGEVEGGMSLSKALSIYPKLFSPFYISMVKSGEASGKLTDVFLYLADYLEKEHEFRGKLVGAMIYPIFILCVFIVIGALIVVYVLPQLTEVLKQSGQELPVATRIVIAVTDFLKANILIIGIGLVLLIISVYQLLKSEIGKKFFDTRILTTPFIGSFFRRIYLSRIALNLSTLISGGLPITQALEITAEVVGNSNYRKIIFETRDEVKKGETISSVLQRHPKVISPFFYQMVVVGEKTGTLDSSLLNVVDFYQADVDRSLDSFVKLLEPIFIICLAILVLILVIAIIMPLYTIEMG